MKDAPYSHLIVQIVEEWLDTLSVRRKPAWSAHELLVHYFNFRLKYIGYEPWIVHWSKELRATLTSHPKKHAIVQIAIEASVGMDLNCYQSREAFNAEVDDDLFNDWHIHHLHLSTETDPRDHRFMKRSDYLLFACFKSPNAYLIDTTTHRSPGWGRKRLLEIMVDNWPEVMRPLQSGWLISPDLTDDEVEVVRKKGYMCGVNIRGKGYILPGHGYMTSGDNMVAVEMANDVYRWSYANRELFTQNKMIFLTHLRAQLRMEPQRQSGLFDHWPHPSDGQRLPLLSVLR